MFEISKILKKLADGKPLTEEERFKIIKKQKVNLEVLRYLSGRFKNLTIEIVGKYEGNVMELMKLSLLEGWCWQTTETAIVFLNDDDYIERGNLIFERYSDGDVNKYYHSWICFKYKGEEYIFDPCLDLLCKKDLYHKVFEVDIRGRVTAKEVRDMLIYNIQNPKQKNNTISESEQKVAAFMKKYFGSALEEKKDEVIIDEYATVNCPFYRNNTGYRAVIEDKKIKKLIAHYYYNA